MSANTFATYPSLHGRVVLVTGGASGIGEAIVEAFARQGARVAFLDLQQAAGEALVERLTASVPTPPVFLRCDLTDTDALQTTVDTVVQAFGGVDVLVNNAGNDARHTLEDVTSAFWDQSIAVNLKHQFFMSQAVVPAMRRAGRGCILNMSSISWAIPSTDLPVYVTAKAAIVGLTRTLAHMLGQDGIRVNCIMPGSIVTERQRRLWLTETYQAEVLAAQAIKRMILPEEVARLCLFLAADDSSSITNQNVVIDGGWI